MLRYLEVFFRNRWLVSIPALLFSIGGSSLVFLVTPTYGVSATIWTERSTYLNVGSEGNPYITPAQIQASRWNELADTGTFSRAIADQAPVTSELAKNQLAYEIRSSMFIGAAGEHSVRVAFWHPSAEVALAVVQLAINEYSKVMVGSVNQQAAEAADFYRERITAYESTIIPKSAAAVAEYLSEHPEIRLSQKEGGPVDSAFVLLEHQATLDRQQYESYREKLDEVLVKNEAFNKNQAISFRIIDPPAFAPGGGKLGKKTLLTFAGAGTGLACGYVVFFLLLAAELDRSVRNSVDVARYLQLPILDIIPEYTADGVAAKRRRTFFRKRKQRSLPKPVQSGSSV